MTPLRKQILRDSVLRVCEISIDDDVLEANVILLGMYDVDMILVMDWLSIHSASIGYFTKKIVFRKSRYPKLEFFGDRRILSICVISTLEAKRLLHKGQEAYLVHVVDKSSLEVTLDSVPVVREFLNVFRKIYQVCLRTES